MLSKLKVVPVEIISPGNKVLLFEKYETIYAQENIKFFVYPS